jgi:heat shock protein beta
MESEEKYQEISKLYGNALRIGMLESDKDKVKIAKLLRFESTRTNCTSLEEVRHSLISQGVGTDW